MSKTLSRSSIAFLLFGPGMAVRIVGPNGSLGKNGWSVPICSTTCAVAALAEGLVVVVMGRIVEKCVRGRRRDDARRMEAMMKFVQFVRKVQLTTKVGMALGGKPQFCVAQMRGQRRCAQAV